MPETNTTVRWSIIDAIPYVIVLIFGIALATLLITIDGFESLHEFTRAHEDWELDELILMAISAIFTILGITTIKMRREIKLRRQEEERVRKMARHDLLTGLPNRRFFEEEIARRTTQENQSDPLVAVIMVNAGGLKLINDRHGFEISDQVLQSITDCIRGAVRQNDVIVRLDGNQFAVILTLRRDASRAMHAAEKIVASVRDIQAEITPYLGIAIYPRDTRDHTELLQYASIALRQAQKDKQKQIAFFDATLNQEQTEYIALQRDMRRALKENEFVPFFQPLISLNNDKLVSFEVLARWEHPTRGLLPPAAFISAAEDMGIISDIFWELLPRACEVIRAWPDNISIALNLSPVQFADPDLGEKILTTVKDMGLKPKQLVIEITESILISDLSSARKFITLLQNHGARIALDDFGTGYSSLQYLHQLPLDGVKIDRSFIASFRESRESALIVSSTVALCHSLGLNTTAEGVEEPEDLSKLKSLGCTFAQGYLFSKPVSAPEATRLVERWHDKAVTGPMLLDS